MRPTEIAYRLRRWADARDLRNPNGHGKTGTKLLRDAGDEIDRLVAIREAAQAHIDTMAVRYSDVRGREVPSGFTMESSDTAVALYDALRGGET